MINLFSFFVSNLIKLICKKELRKWEKRKVRLKVGWKMMTRGRVDHTVITVWRLNS